jgi:hypothetical protein
MQRAVATSRGPRRNHAGAAAQRALASRSGKAVASAGPTMRRWRRGPSRDSAQLGRFRTSACAPGAQAPPFWARPGGGGGPDLGRADPAGPHRLPHARDPGGLRVPRHGGPGLRWSQGRTTTRCVHELKPIPTYRGAARKGHVPGDLDTALAAYAAHYREITGRTIAVWVLVVQMLQRFVETDREFQAWRRRTQNRAGAGPTTGSPRDQREGGGKRRAMVRQDKESPHTRRKSSLCRTKS